MLPTPSTDRHRLRTMPGLDGLRGLAVIAVLLFHSEFSWARGGHLGVTTFFVLSGFLITSLLLVEHDRKGRIDLRGFWGRRARRLVPAALVTVGLCAAYIAATNQVSSDLLGDGVAALLWVANWRFIVDGASYADLFSEPSPFRHFWSLAIEEQFYLVVPVLVAGVVGSVRTMRAARWALAAVFATAAVVSTEILALVHEPGAEPLRAYYGTDARLAEPAVGALLAVVMFGGAAGPRLLSGRARHLVDAAGMAGLAALAWLSSSLGVWDGALYNGGFLLAALCASTVVLAASQNGGLVARLLSGELIAALGRVSYGVYLFHWPIFLWLTPERTGLGEWRLFMLRSLVTVIAAALSYGILELPVRARPLPRRVGPLAWANATVVLVAALAIASGPLAIGRSDPTEVASGISSAPRSHGDARTGRAAGRSPRAAPPTAGQGAAAAPAVPLGGAPQHAGQPHAPAATQEPAATTTTTAVPGEDAVRVAFIGDSVSKNLAAGTQRWGAESGKAVVNDFSIQGCPISRGGERRFDEFHPWPIPEGCEWWADDDSEEWYDLQAFRPDVIVVHDSTNEIGDRKLPEWPSWMHPGDPVFDAWLTREYRALIDAVNARSIGVLILNAPCADWPRAGSFKYIDEPERRVEALNTVVYHEIGTSATRVVDLFSYLCPDGEFTETVDGTENARPDGLHLSDEAATRAAERLLGPAILEVHAQRPGRPPPPPER